MSVSTAGETIKKSILAFFIIYKCGKVKEKLVEYSNISELIGYLKHDLKKYNKEKFEEYARHIDGYIFPDMCRIHKAINSKIMTKVVYTRQVLPSVREIYALFCLIIEDMAGVKIGYENPIFNDLEKWLEYFNNY